MAATRIDGKAIAAQVCEELVPRIQALKEKGVTPGLHVILVGEDPASMTYVNNKEKRAASLGMNGKVHRLPKETTQKELEDLIDSLNEDCLVHGILVQLPLPGHLNEESALARILPEKDVDGFHVVNAGLLLSGGKGVLPCTPAGCMRLIESTGQEVSGTHAVVIGRSNIVGKPASLLLQRAHATVTMCHSRTKDLARYTRDADILVVAAGKAGLITGDMIKPGSIVIDVGMHRIDGKLCGDVVFAEAEQVAGYITPVPGGVGPMTIAMLMQNAVQAAENTLK